MAFSPSTTTTPATGSSTSCSRVPSAAAASAAAAESAGSEAAAGVRGGSAEASAVGGGAGAEAATASSTSIPASGKTSAIFRFLEIDFLFRPSLSGHASSFFLFCVKMKGTKEKASLVETGSDSREWKTRGKRERSTSVESFRRVFFLFSPEVSREEQRQSFFFFRTSERCAPKASF